MTSRCLVGVNSMNNAVVPKLVVIAFIVDTEMAFNATRGGGVDSLGASAGSPRIDGSYKALPPAFFRANGIKKPYTPALVATRYQPMTARRANGRQHR